MAEMMQEMPGTPMGQEAGGGDVGDKISGLLAAAQMLGDSVSQSEAVPPEVREQVASVTEQYVTVMSQVMAGAGVQPAETIPGAQPVAPQGAI